MKYKAMGCNKLSREITTDELINAIKVDDLEKLKYMLSGLNYVSSKVVQAAAINGRLEAIHCLLHKKIRYDDRNTHSSCLYVFVMCASMPTIRTFVKRFPAYADTVIWLVCKTRPVDDCCALITGGFFSKKLLAYDDDMFSKVFQRAVVDYSLNDCMFLLSKYNKLCSGEHIEMLFHGKRHEYIDILNFISIIHFKSSLDRIHCLKGMVGERTFQPQEHLDVVGPDFKIMDGLTFYRLVYRYTDHLKTIEHLQKNYDMKCIMQQKIEDGFKTGRYDIVAAVFNSGGVTEAQLLDICRLVHCHHYKKGDHVNKYVFDNYFNIGLHQQYIVKVFPEYRCNKPLTS
jgi:hypothetical protein